MTSGGSEVKLGEMETLEKDLYERFILAHPSGTFFQSFAFGEFQEKQASRGKSFALIAREGEEVVGTCLTVKQKLPFGKSWLWIPYGPLIKKGFEEMALPQIFEDLARISEEEEVIFCRVEPPGGFPEEVGFRETNVSYTPRSTLLLDLTLSEEKLLAQMKPKGRYNIKIAKKHGIVISQSDESEKDLNAFYKILQETGGRDQFGIHTKSYYSSLLKSLPATLFLARHGSRNGEVLAGIIVVFFRDTATYYYGASSNGSRNLMAPYLLQWEAILEAKRRGIKTYDFLGIADNPRHSWAGITKFKRQFGGLEKSYPQAFEIIYRPFWFTFYQLAKKLST